MSGQVSAFGTDYDAVVDWMQGKLPVLEPMSHVEVRSLTFALQLRADDKREQCERHEHAPFLRRSAPSTLRTHTPLALESDSGLSSGSRFESIDRTNICADPSSASGRRRAELAARARRAAERPTPPPPRQLLQASAELREISRVAESEGGDLPSSLRAGSQKRRALLAQAHAGGRTRATPGRARPLPSGGWAFEQGAWSLVVQADDPVLGGLLAERLRHERRSAASPRRAHAQLGARVAALSAASDGGARRARPPAASTLIAPPAWLAEAHLEFERQVALDEAAAAAEPPLTAGALEALRAAHAAAAGLSASDALPPDAELVWRARMARNPWLRALLRHALSLFDADSDGALSEPEYVRMSRALYRALHDGYVAHDAERIAREDWALDSHGEGRVGAERWLGMWLDLSLLWTTGLSLRELGAFLLSILLQMTLAPSRAPSAAERAPRTRTPPRTRVLPPVARRVEPAPVLRAPLVATVADFPSRGASPPLPQRSGLGRGAEPSARRARSLARPSSLGRVDGLAAEGSMLSSASRLTLSSQPSATGGGGGFATQRMARSWADLDSLVLASRTKSAPGTALRGLRSRVA